MPKYNPPPFHQPVIGEILNESKLIEEEWIREILDEKYPLISIYDFENIPLFKLQVVKWTPEFTDDDFKCEKKLENKFMFAYSSLKTNEDFLKYLNWHCAMKLDKIVKRGIVDEGGRYANNV